MIEDARVEDWRRFRQASAGRFRSGAIIGAAATGTISLLALMTPGGILDMQHPKLWLALAGLYTAWFPFVDDWIYVARMDRRIAAAERESDSPKDCAGTDPFSVSSR